MFCAWFSFVRLAPHRPHGLRCRAAVARLNCDLLKISVIVMGKSVGLLGPISGKVGNMVGYEIKDSKQSQGWREYKPNVRNPQTDTQLDQRAKLLAINNQYRAIKELILRGQENKAYGYPSRKAWLSRALGSQFDGPWLPKGSDFMPPVRDIAMTYGSIPSVTCEFSTSDLCWKFPNLGLDTAGSYETIGGLSAIFIAAGYQEGDQVTFVFAYGLQNDSIGYTWKSFIINPTNTESCADALGITFQEIQSVLATDEIDEVPQLTNSACFVTISRDGDGAHLRSTARWALSPAMESMWYGSQMSQARARASYRRTQSASTNWELDPGVEGGGGGGGTVTAFTVSGYELVPSSLSNVDAEPAKIVDANGQQYFVRAHTSAGGTRYLIGQGGSDYTSTGSTPTGATDANTVDPCAASNIASGCRAWLLSKGVSADLLVIE